MYRMGMMSLLASDAGVDAGRCMRMALVHDVAEAIVGDITPHCNVSDDEKHKLEADAIQQIKQMLGQHTFAGTQLQRILQANQDQPFHVRHTFVVGSARHPLGRREVQYPFLDYRWFLQAVYVQGILQFARFL